MPARDYNLTGHDDPKDCMCSYHQRLREDPIEPPDRDDYLTERVFNDEYSS
jgi:hypothetical protein